MKNNLQKEINWLIKEKYPSTRATRSGQVLKYFKKDMQRLKAGEPVDYVIGFTEFLGCRIDLSYKPLIPRLETEFWVQKVIEDIRESFGYTQNKSLRVLDMFAGSGCIGIAVLKNANFLLCDIAEKDSNLVKQIKKNLKLNKIDKKRYKVIQSDIFSNIKQKYNFILANPPYIPIKNRNMVRKSALKYEPKLALFGGQDGLFYIEKFLKQAKNYLTENGIIYMEFDGSAIQKNKIGKMLESFSYKSWQFYKDQYGRYRWVVVNL